jgi:hypothetical protein
MSDSTAATSVAEYVVASEWTNRGRVLAGTGDSGSEIVMPGLTAGGGRRKTRAPLRGPLHPCRARCRC